MKKKTTTTKKNTEMSEDCVYSHSDGLWLVLRTNHFSMCCSAEEISV